MPWEKMDGYVFLDKDPDTGDPLITPELREMFLPKWFHDALAKESTPAEVEAFEEAYLQQAAKQLGQLSDNPQNWLDHGVPVGASKAKFGNKSIPIKDILFTGAAYSVPIFIALSALTTGPGALLLAAKAAAAIGPATAKFYTAVNTYSPTQLDVHTAVVTAMNRNGTRTLKGQGATLEEIEKILETDPNLIKPKSLKAVLDDMVKKKMLVSSVDGGVEVFSPNPL
jgi:hypothetical protein